MTHELTIGLAVAGGLQLLLMLQLWRTARAAARGGRRIEQLTSALELLTDTTESGFVNVASELSRVGARPMAPAATRRAATERIAAAVRDGRALADVAAEEGLSESEVRLHLGLDRAPEPRSIRESSPAQPGPVVRHADPDVLGDLERWMSTLGSGRPASGAPRHAAVRV
ncbi:MAG: hypothetical protein AB7U83_21615 [Vicinamibacterales bacterium]